MKPLRVSLVWLSTFLMLTTNLSLEGCGAKESPATAQAQAAQQQDASRASTQAAQQQNASSAPAANATSAQNNAPALLAEVNLTADGLDELLAPIALYPDPVLAIMLQASVNPQEVMDGGNWLVLDQNKDLKEAALDEASKKAGFTPVLQALLHYPSVVDLMCTQWDWTKQLGAAYEANPKAVLDSVQRLRAQAVDTGALKSSPQMKVDVTQSNGQQVVELKPADPKVVYIPQYNPEQVFQTTITTTTRPDGTVTTTTTTTGPAPTTGTSTSSSNTTVVQEKSGVSTGTAVMIGLLSFGAGIAVGAAINSNHYYYPAWGYGGVWYGPRPYYPPPYRPVYYPGWGPGYPYHRPPYYHNTIVINNNYYNRFNNNGNLNPNYKPRPVPYNTNPNSTYSRNMGGQPGNRQGANYRPNNPNVSTRPATGNPPNRGGGANVGNNVAPAQRPATGNNAANNPNNWRGQTTYQGNKASNNRPTATTTPNTPSRNPSGDRGFAQNGGARPSTGNGQPNRLNTGNNQNAGQRPNASQNARPAGMAPTTPPTGNQPANRIATGNHPTARPATGTQQPATRPAQQPQNRQQTSAGGAFSGASSSNSDRAASKRGQASMGATAARQTQSRPAGNAKPR